MARSGSLISTAQTGHRPSSGGGTASGNLMLPVGGAAARGLPLRARTARNRRGVAERAPTDRRPAPRTRCSQAACGTALTSRGPHDLRDTGHASRPGARREVAPDACACRLSLVHVRQSPHRGSVQCYCTPREGDSVGARHALGVEFASSRERTTSRPGRVVRTGPDASPGLSCRLVTICPLHSIPDASRLRVAGWSHQRVP